MKKVYNLLCVMWMIVLGNITCAQSGYTPVSTANWYGYAAYCITGDNWQNKFISFSMQDSGTVSEASEEISSPIYAATYHNGYIWCVNSSEGSLCRATLNNTAKTIGELEVMVENFVPNNFIVNSSAYNPTDGRIYFLSTSDESYELKSFDPEQPEIINDHGIFSEMLMTMAINGHGEAFGISMNTQQSATLYSINLTDASLVPIGSTGLSATFAQSMAFDMETGELFWAQISSSDDVGLYYVDHTNANVTYLGQIGGGGAEITGLFAVPEGEISLEEYVPEKLVVYPNPAINRLYINNAEGELVNIFDNMGRLVMEEQYNNHLNINNLPNGIYIIKTSARTAKFIKN